MALTDVNVLIGIVLVGIQLINCNCDFSKFVRSWNITGKTLHCLRSTELNFSCRSRCTMCLCSVLGNNINNNIVCCCKMPNTFVQINFKQNIWYIWMIIKNCILMFSKAIIKVLLTLFLRYFVNSYTYSTTRFFAYCALEKYVQNEVADENSLLEFVIFHQMYWNAYSIILLLSSVIKLLAVK